MKNLMNVNKGIYMKKIVFLIALMLFNSLCFAKVSPKTDLQELQIIINDISKADIMGLGSGKSTLQSIWTEKGSEAKWRIQILTEEKECVAIRGDIIFDGFAMLSTTYPCE